MVLICPYCDIEISEKLVEAEDGCCPECGTLITANSVADYDEDGDEYEEDEIKKLKRDSGTQFDSRFIEQGGPNI